MFGGLFWTNTSCMSSLAGRQSKSTAFQNWKNRFHPRCVTCVAFETNPCFMPLAPEQRPESAAPSRPKSGNARRRTPMVMHISFEFKVLKTMQQTPKTTCVHHGWTDDEQLESRGGKRRSLSALVFTERLAIGDWCVDIAFQTNDLFLPS